MFVSIFQMMATATTETTTNTPEVVMRRLSGYDLFRQEARVRAPSAAAASTWKSLDDDQRRAFADRAKECAPVASKSSRKRKQVTVIDAAEESVSTEQITTETKTKKKKRKPSDPTLPKRPLSAFIFFSVDRRPGLMREQPTMNPKECLQAIGKEWAQLVDREPYQDMANRDKLRYTEAMASRALPMRMTAA